MNFSCGRAALSRVPHFLLLEHLLPSEEIHRPGVLQALVLDRDGVGRQEDVQTLGASQAIMSALAEWERDLLIARTR